MHTSPVFQLAVLSGDGIGPEVITEGLKILKALEQRFGFHVNCQSAPVGGAGVLDSGVPLPPQTLALCKAVDAVYFGAVGGPQFDSLAPHLRPEQGLLALRKALGLYANLRPIKAHPQLFHASTLKPQVLAGTDMVIVRELTSGLYFGTPKYRKGSGADEHALDSLSYTQPEIERIARVGFELALMRQNKLCSVDKANVLATSQLWRSVVDNLKAEYPTVEVTHMYVDNAAMQLIKNPLAFDVLLTENMFGDILSDEASMLTGSLGMLASASLGKTSPSVQAQSQAIQRYGLYEPCHGSAPDIAGQNKANPLAAILSLSMLLDLSFGLSEAAKAVEVAVTNVLEQGLRTSDIAEQGETIIGTTQMGDAIVDALLA
jgi:3-isopropylmalate dehydrogenase